MRYSDSRQSGLFALAALLCAGCHLARAGDCVSAPGGTPRVTTVSIPQQGGGTLTAQVYAPDASLQTSPCPCITMLPGGGAPISSVAWAADDLARNGYVVIITQPQSGGSTSSYNTAAKSGIDFLQSPANPYLGSTDSSRVGAAGWSLGARTLSRTQAEDLRIDAIVAWDNLAVSESGDLGSPACTNVSGTIRAPRVPAMGQASDSCSGSADIKKTAFEAWRAAGVPAFEVVFAGANHFLWSDSSSPTQQTAAKYYTRAWFDRWLKNEPGALDRLLSRAPAGLAVSSLLSSTFRSAAFLDGIYCPDLRAACARCTADFNRDGFLDFTTLIRS